MRYDNAKTFLAARLRQRAEQRAFISEQSGGLMSDQHESAQADNPPSGISSLVPTLGAGIRLGAHFRGEA